jgi:hypothetical protein
MEGEYEERYTRLVAAFHRRAVADRIAEQYNAATAALENSVSLWSEEHAHLRTHPDPEYNYLFNDARYAVQEIELT